MKNHKTGWNTALPAPPGHVAGGVERERVALADGGARARDLHYLGTHGERVKKTLFDAIESVKYLRTLCRVSKTLFDTI